MESEETDKRRKAAKTVFPSQNFEDGNRFLTSKLFKTGLDVFRNDAFDD
jgi:hypothetical protein